MPRRFFTTNVGCSVSNAVCHTNSQEQGTDALNGERIKEKQAKGWYHRRGVVKHLQIPLADAIGGSDSTWTTRPWSVTSI
jgi:hypothetical protein